MFLFTEWRDGDEAHSVAAELVSGLYASQEHTRDYA